MRILRLTNSNDFAGDVADGDRSYRAVEAAMEAAFGEPVETIRKVIWPADDLPDIVERWVVQYRPDIVLLKPNSFWYAYESVPARVRRKLGWLGRAGQSVGDSGFRAARQPWLAYNPVFPKFRYVAQATIGGDTHLPVEYCLANMEAVIRRVLRHEDTVLVVRGSRGGRDRPELPKKVAARNDARRAQFRAGMERICAELSVPLLSKSERRKYDTSVYQADRFHANAAGHAQQGEFEARGMVEAWRRHLEGMSPAPPVQSPGAR